MAKADLSDDQHDDFQESWFFKTHMGLHGSALIRAAKQGLLREGTGWLHKKNSTRVEYNTRVVRALYPEISLSGKVMSLEQRAKANRPFLCSSEAKRKLSVAMHEATALLATLQHQIEQVYQARSSIERDWRDALWEQKDCPYCKGTASLEGRRCPCCGPEEGMYEFGGPLEAIDEAWERVDRYTADAIKELRERYIRAHSHKLPARLIQLTDAIEDRERRDPRSVLPDEEEKTGQALVGRTRPVNEGGEEERDDPL